MYGIFGFNLFELVVVVVVSMFVCLFVCFCFVVGVHWGSTVYISLDSRPQREWRPGILCMRMRVHYPKKGVIRVFVDTVSKISCILFVF